MNQKLMSANKLKVSNKLREVRRFAVALRNGAIMNARRLKGSSADQDTVIVLSLGDLGRSAEVARQAFLLGYRVHVFCKDYPTPEAQFATDWSRLDCREDFKQALEIAKRLDPKAILLESKNLLLPMQNFLATELSLTAVGDLATKTSNSKIALRESIDDNGLPNLSWCRYKGTVDNDISFPLVIKPDLGTASKGVRYIANESELKEPSENNDAFDKDESTGDEMMLEEYVNGRQFDIEGIAKDGVYYPLCIVEEFYEAAPPYFPPTWFHFNPPLPSDVEETLISYTKSTLKALGVKNGSWHLEQRLDKHGTPRALDYANRMGYNLLVSEASGLSFSREYIKTMVSRDYKPTAINSRSMIQLFAFDIETLNKLKRISNEQSQHIFAKSFFPYEFSFHLYLGYVVISVGDFAELSFLLEKYDLTPPEFQGLYDT